MIEIKTDWEDSDLPTYKDLDRIENNIDILRELVK